MGRPRKTAGTRVADQLHVGWRLSPEQTRMMKMILASKKKQLEGMGVPARGVTISGLARVWLDERLLREWKALAKKG